MLISSVNLNLKNAIKLFYYCSKILLCAAREETNGITETGVGKNRRVQEIIYHTRSTLWKYVTRLMNKLLLVKPHSYIVLLLVQKVRENCEHT